MFSTSPAPEIAPQTNKCSKVVPLVTAYVLFHTDTSNLDTGTSVTINRDLVPLRLTDVMPSSIILNSESSNTLFTEGDNNLSIRIRGEEFTLSFIVVRNYVFLSDIMLGSQSLRENDIKLIPTNLAIVLRGIIIPLANNCSNILR